MEPIEIIVIIACILIVGGVLGNYIYKKITHKPTGDCGYCKTHNKGAKLVKDYHKKYGKKSKIDSNARN